MIHLLLAMGSQLPFEWASQHLQTIGWPVLIVAAWRVATFIKGLTGRMEHTVSQIDKMSTNCFPTMQASLQTQDGHLNDLVKYAAKQDQRWEQWMTTQAFSARMHQFEMDHGKSVIVASSDKEAKVIAVEKGHEIG
jgi:hypothetical protein